LTLQSAGMQTKALPTPHSSIGNGHFASVHTGSIAARVAAGVGAALMPNTTTAPAPRRKPAPATAVATANALFMVKVSKPDNPKQARQWGLRLHVGAYRGDYHRIPRLPKRYLAPAHGHYRGAAKSAALGNPAAGTPYSAATADISLSGRSSRLSRRTQACRRSR
jgi:hypothetical protein